MTQVALFGQAIDTDQSDIGFDIKNMFSNVEGALSGLEGTVTFDASNLSDAIFDVCLPANGIDTQNERRDNHLMAEDYFDSSSFGEICFESTTVRTDGTDFIATGDLTIKGITKSVEIPFTYNNNRFEGNLEIDRYDFGIGGSGDFMIGRSVNINISASIK